jgi:hypothetical protein
MVDGLYSIVKNYGGDDLQELCAQIRDWKIIYTDGGDSGAEFLPVEAPYLSKKEALQFIENRITTDFMVPTGLSGRAVTATEINLAREPLDFKVDLFEMQCVQFVSKILGLLGINEEPKFKRRTVTNDVETTKALMSMAEFLPIEAVYDLAPLVPDEKREEYLELYAGRTVPAVEEEKWTSHQ